MQIYEKWGNKLNGHNIRNINCSSDRYKTAKYQKFKSALFHQSNQDNQPHIYGNGLPWSSMGAKNAQWYGLATWYRNSISREIHTARRLTVVDLPELCEIVYCRMKFRIHKLAADPSHTDLCFSNCSHQVNDIAAWVTAEWAQALATACTQCICIYGNKVILSCRTHLSGHVDEVHQLHCMLVLAEVVEQRPVHHELGDDVERLALCAHAHQLDELAVRQLVHDLSLLQERFRRHLSLLHCLDGDVHLAAPLACRGQHQSESVAAIRRFFFFRKRTNWQSQIIWCVT